MSKHNVDMSPSGTHNEYHPPTPPLPCSACYEIPNKKVKKSYMSDMLSISSGVINVT